MTIEYDNLENFLCTEDIWQNAEAELLACGHDNLAGHLRRMLEDANVDYFDHVETPALPSHWQQPKPGSLVAGFKKAHQEITQERFEEVLQAVENALPEGSKMRKEISNILRGMEIEEDKKAPTALQFPLRAAPAA